jgi:large subunit ribosomal protein L25
MEAVLIDAKLRDKTKKEACKRYRKEGLIPSIIYGQGNNINILIDSKKFTKVSNNLTRSTIINIKAENGKEYKVLIKDYQKDYIKDQFTHVDFYELHEGKPVSFRVHLNFIGTPIGVRDGGVMEKQMLDMEIECLPKDIISQIDVNVEHLKINESLHVRDIKVEDKFKVLSHAEDVVVHISGKMAEEEEKPAEEMTVDKVETTAQKSAKEEVKEEKADTKEKTKE